MIQKNPKAVLVIAGVLLTGAWLLDGFSGMLITSATGIAGFLIGRHAQRNLP